MKAKIHPRYGPATVTCACGSSFMTRATKSDIRIEICSQCHPFFTGRQKILDTEGRVERFKAKYAGLPRKPAVRRRSAPGSR